MTVSFELFPLINLVNQFYFIKPLTQFYANENIIDFCHLMSIAGFQKGTEPGMPELSLGRQV